MEILDAVKQLDALFAEYGIKDTHNILGYRDNFITYVKSLEGVNLWHECRKREFFFKFRELQKTIGEEVDLLNNYTMNLSVADIKQLGQCFTPQSLINVTNIIIDENAQSPVFYDAAGGTGSLVIGAYYKWLRAKKRSFDEQFLPLIEVDEYDIYNCYCCVFNFITRGLNAIVRNKNTITGETYNAFIMTNPATAGLEFSWYSDYKTITEDRIYEFG